MDVGPIKSGSLSKMYLMMAMHMIWPRDPNSVKDAKLEREAAARVWQFAKPYQRQISGFLVALILQAILGLVPALLFGRIIDSVIPNKDRRLLGIFAIAIVVAALLRGVVGLVER